MFETAQTIIEENETIEKVVILDRTPRFDGKVTDPFGLKNKLAEYGNRQNAFELEKSRSSKIVIGKHSIICNEQTYGNPNNQDCDGFHMRGPKGSESYTKSVISILSQNLHLQPKLVNFQPSSIPKRNKRQNEANFQPSSRQESNFPPGATSFQPSGIQESKFSRNERNVTSTPFSKSSNPSVFQFAVKTFNRFSTLLN